MNQTSSNSTLVKLLIAVLFTTANFSAFAQSNPTSSAQGFNVFLKNGANLQSGQMQGALAIGGDLTLNGNYTVASNSGGTFKVGGVTVGLLVGGKVIYTSGSSFNVNNDAYAIVGNSTGSVAWYKDNNGASSNIRISRNGYGDQPYIQIQNSAPKLGVSASTNPVFQSGLVDFNAAFTQFQTSSTCMSTGHTNISITNSNQNVLPLTGFSGQIKLRMVDGVNYWNISGTDLNNVTNLIYDVNSPDDHHVLVINVNAAGSFNWNVWNQSGVGNSNSPYVIYNFYNTTRLTISGSNQIEGTVFAPLADINKTTSSNIDGQVIANSLIQTGGTINSANFNYSLPTCVCSNPVVADISGSSSVCIGSTTNLSNSTNGGVWSSSSLSIATVTSGVVTAVAAGSTTIRYAVTNACGTTTVSFPITVKSTSTSTTNASICSGRTYIFNGTTYSTAGTYVAHLTNAAGCDSAATLNLTVNSNVVPSVSISASASTICTGSTVNFTASASNGGASPVYQWQKNGVNVGTNSVTYSNASLVNGDIILCVVTPNNTCQTSNSVTSNSDTITVLASGTWSGATNSDWSNTGNWCGGVVPTVAISATIPSGVANKPTISGTSTVKDLVIASNTTLKVTGTLQVAGRISNEGTVDATKGTIELNGNTAQNMPTNIFWNKQISNLIINNPAGITLLDSLIVTGSINPKNGVLNTAGKLFLKSDSLGTGRINQGKGNYINGLVTVQRYISPKAVRKYSFIGSPVIQTIQNSWQKEIYITGAGTGGTPCGNTTGNGGLTDKYNSNGFDRTITNVPSMFTYQATPVNGSRWVPIPNTDKTYLTPGIGYKVNIRGNRNSTTYDCNNQLNSSNPGAPEAVTLVATGTVVTGDVIIKLNDTTQQKYTLLANPYLSQISYTAFKAANPTINPKIWTYSPFGNNNYTTYASGVIVNGAEGYDNTFGDYIAEGQAFFVEANQNGNVVFQENQKTNGAIPNAKYFGANIQKMIRVGLKTVANEPLDEVVALFNNVGSKSVTANDAISFNGGSQVLTIIKGASKLAIATLPEAIIKDTVSLSVTSSTVGTFRFSFGDYAGIDTSVSIVLKDNFMNTTQDIRRNQTYYFNVTSDTKSAGASRFQIILAKVGNTLPVNFTSITADKNNESVSVKWQVAQESNIASYEVERSIDGASFEKVTSVKAIVSSNYIAEDKNLPTNATTIYYRIKAVGEDGTFIYSATSKIIANNPHMVLNVYPNPVQSQLNVTVENAISKNFTVNLYTVQGKQVTNNSNKTTTTGSIHIDASTLSSGIYIVELTDEKGNVLKEKFVKQ